MTCYDKDDVLNYVVDHDVRFVRLSFCDIFGQLKNVSIPATELEKAFLYGVGFDASAIRGFLNVEESNLVLFPDPSTLTVLPWRQSESGTVIRLYCNILNSDLEPFEGDGRYLLKKAVQDLAKEGWHVNAGVESEFYLFKKGENGDITLEPMDEAGYLDIAPLDKGENVRRDIILNLEEMGISVASSHHEKGPGQNEISFNPTSLLSAADNQISFKAMVKTTANRFGLFSSFLPKPLLDQSGSGMHISLSFQIDGVPFDSIKESAAAGILKYIREYQVFLNPVANSYERLGSYEAPERINYGTGNRALLLRIPSVKAESSKRIELRLADPSCNPYLALLLTVKAAERGIKEKLRLSDIKEGPLSDNLLEAVEEAEGSAFVSSVLPEDLLKTFLRAKRADWKRAASSKNPEIFSRDLELPVT